MRPVLFELLGTGVPAYGATLAAVFACGLLALSRLVRPLGVSGDQMLDIAVICTGSVVLWVVAGGALQRLGLPWSGSLSALPVLALGAFALLGYLRRRDLPAEPIFDAIAPMAALGLAIQYGAGTFLAGTAFGTPTGLPWGVSFPAGSPAHETFGAQPLHPVQLYMGLLLVAVAVASWRWRGQLAPGLSALATFIAIAVVYLAVSPLRGGTTSLIAGGAPRTSEIAAVLIVIYCAYKAWHVARRS